MNACHIFQLTEGAAQARGLTIVIDVCRAFTTAAYCIDQGADCIMPVGTVDEALSLRTRFPDALLIGEVDGRKVEQFDLGNSPSELLGMNFEGRTVVQRTSAGTQGIVRAVQAQEILTGAFVNAGAIVRYVQRQQPEQVSLVCMGWRAERECAEDTLCAELLRSRIMGREVDFAEIVLKVKQSKTGEKFRDPGRPWMPEQDLDLCLSLDLFDFVLRDEGQPGSACLRPLYRI